MASLQSILQEIREEKDEMIRQCYNAVQGRGQGYAAIVVEKTDDGEYELCICSFMGRNFYPGGNSVIVFKVDAQDLNESLDDDLYYSDDTPSIVLELCRRKGISLAEAEEKVEDEDALRDKDIMREVFGNELVDEVIEEYKRRIISAYRSESDLDEDYIEKIYEL